MSWAGGQRRTLESSILGWRSGLPFNVTSGSDFAGNGRSAGQRPDAVAGVDPYLEELSTQTWLNASALGVDAVRRGQRFRKLGYNPLLGRSASAVGPGSIK